ncbi:MAG: hypothetical protein JXA25_00110 [Anaerolineales bacterium]|nr:hypothetical protein [Anaerolineales bacterium]
MLFPTESNLLNVVLILAGIALAWGVIKAFFRITTKIFATGCAVLLALVVLGTILGWIG